MGAVGTLARYTGRDRKLLPARTAVLVVDVQNAEISPAVEASHPWFHDRVLNHAVPNIERLISAARAAGVEVIYTVIESLTRDGRDRSLDHKLSNIHVPKGSDLAKIIDAVAPIGDEIVLPKSSSGVFNSTMLDYVLRNIGIENVIVAGFLTDQCIDMAIRDGADRGYYMICASDCCTSYSQSRHDNALIAFGGYCRTQTVDEILADFVETRGDAAE